jgi:WD40 repeat protein
MMDPFASGTRREALSANPPSDSDLCVFIGVRFSPDGKYIAAFAREDPRIFIWDGQNGRHLIALNGHTVRVCALAFSPDSSILVSVSPDDAFLWDVEDKAIRSMISLQSIVIDSLEPKDVIFNSGGNLLAIIFSNDKSCMHGFLLASSQPRSTTPPYILP